MASSRSSIVFFASHSSKHAFFKLPEEAKLAKQKAIKEQDDVAYGQDENVVSQRKPDVLLTISSEKGNHRPLEEEHREAGAGKNDEHDEHLKAAF